MTSIAAWTVGSLAGNYAYHEVMQGSAKPKISKASCPSAVRVMIDKLKAIEKETVSLVDGCREATKTSGQLNLTPIIRLFAYENWLQSNRQAIRAEISTAYQASISDGYLWPPTIIEDVQNGLDSLLGSLNDITCDLSGALDKFYLTIPNHEMRQKVVEIMNQRQRLCKVDVISCKLIDANDGNFIVR
jgi:hypothetical protein